MIPHSPIPDKQTQARPFFRGLMALLVIAMAGVFIAEAVPLLLSPGAVQVACPANPRKFLCELGAAIVQSIPAGAQRTVLGVTGLAITGGLLWLTWVGAWRKAR